MSAAGYAADRTAANCAEVILGYLIEYCGIQGIGGTGETGGNSGESIEARLFTRIRGLEAAERAASLVARELSLAKRYTIGRLLDYGITESDGYRLKTVTETTTSVDKELLRREEPALYEKIARVPANILVRELGHDTLRSMLLEACGSEKVRQYDTVAVEDLDAVFSHGAEAARFKRTITYPAGYEVVIS